MNDGLQQYYYIATVNATKTRLQICDKMVYLRCLPVLTASWAMDQLSQMVMVLHTTLKLTPLCSACLLSTHVRTQAHGG
jgi:hypothetical protein